MYSCALVALFNALSYLSTKKAMFGRRLTFNSFLRFFFLVGICSREILNYKVQKSCVLSRLFLTIRVPPLSTFLAVLFVWEKSIEKLTTFIFIYSFDYKL